ncbi:hypothetical protein NIASO_01755 [Niabella soli DSM 19437]|uniref:Uncharacterized protein n=1 Tax=Niabella soli DSM 19437 TaxID=929713 RepID=W0F5K0_9BACT|nr:hypothetical protein NIASO_01755 [Niabella soli DSM 19437]
MVKGNKSKASGLKNILKPLFTRNRRGCALREVATFIFLAFFKQ